METPHFQEAVVIIANEASRNCAESNVGADMIGDPVDTSSDEAYRVQRGGDKGRQFGGKAEPLHFLRDGAARIGDRK